MFTAYKILFENRARPRRGQRRRAAAAEQFFSSFLIERTCHRTASCSKPYAIASVYIGCVYYTRVMKTSSSSSSRTDLHASRGRVVVNIPRCRSPPRGPLLSPTPACSPVNSIYNIVELCCCCCCCYSVAYIILSRVVFVFNTCMLYVDAFFIYLFFNVLTNDDRGTLYDDDDDDG